MRSPRRPRFGAVQREEGAAFESERDADGILGLGIPAPRGGSASTEVERATPVPPLAAQLGLAERFGMCLGPEGGQLAMDGAGPGCVGTNASGLRGSAGIISQPRLKHPKEELFCAFAYPAPYPENTRSTDPPRGGFLTVAVIIL